MVKISIIIAVYNVEKYIIKCLESVKKQTFSDYECLIISDGSKDNSVNFAKEYIKDDTRFRVIEKENGGYGSVLERGIEESKGEYILICDPDDYLADYALEHLYECAILSNSDLVFGAKYDIYENPYEEVYNPGYEVTKYNLEGVKTYRNEENDFSMFFSFECSPHSKLYKKNIIYSGPYPCHTAHTDMILYCLTMNKIITVTYTDKPCSYYLLEREGNTMTASKDKFIKSHIEVLNYTIDKINDNYNVQSYICVLDTFRYCVSVLNKAINKNEYRDELEKFHKRMYCKKKYFKKYLKYAQGGFFTHLSNSFLFSSITSTLYINYYLNKNMK